MTILIKHLFESPKADGPDSTVVQPSDWNEAHVITMAQSKVLGRKKGSDGAAEELPLEIDSTGQSLLLPSGTTAQRPTGVEGMIRYNTTLAQLETYRSGAWANIFDTAIASQADSTVLGRAVGAGTGAPTALTRAQLCRLVYNIGTVYDTFNSSADDGFVFLYGANLSRTTYADLFAKWGTTFGVGDGSTTFGTPDLRGRVTVGKDNMGGSTAGRVTSAGSGITGTTLGASGGAETVTLTTAQIPSHTHTGTTGTESNDHTHNITKPAYYGLNGGSGRGWCRADSGGQSTSIDTAGASATHTHSFTTNSAGTGGSHTNMQPSIICNKQAYTGVHA